MNKVSLVATIIGVDQPGVVERIAATVVAHDANWIESRMAHLAGQFAGILRVEAPSGQVEALRQAFADLKSDGLESLLHTDAANAEEPAGETQLLELVGHDRPGIVREVTGVLSKLGVNVEELTTFLTSAANTGQPLFNATIALRLPSSVSTRQLQTALEAVAADMMVDIRLKPTE